jgi:tRNA threonylcarbamoyladenosine biosynthesis protein TsaB
MPLILSIETSAKVCSVALHKSGKLITSSEILIEKSHSKLITVIAEELLSRTEFSFSQLDAVAVSKGPGSYTGLRIGVSVAKGFCYALDKPLIAVNTLEALAYGVIKNSVSKDFIYCPMIDARRMEVYCLVTNHNKDIIQETSPVIIDEHSFEDLLIDNKILFFGDGSGKCQSVINSPNAYFIEDIYPEAKNVGFLATEKFNKNETEDVAYFEPYYLKDFVSTSKK